MTQGSPLVKWQCKRTFAPSCNLYIKKAYPFRVDKIREIKLMFLLLNKKFASFLAC
jgi:hypothetical protein